MIRSKDEYNELVHSLKKSANEVNGTYEKIGVVERIIGTTQYVKDVFGISDEFEYEFLEAISKFESKEIGPYITEKYFMLIPSLKEAIMQMKEDCVETRRCVIQFPAEHCFQSMQFMVRENTVHVICHMRSCDAVKNLPHDVWICSKMADIFVKYLNDLLGIHPYEYHAITMMFGSLHVFKEDVKNVL